MNIKDNFIKSFENGFLLSKFRVRSCKKFAIFTGYNLVSVHLAKSYEQVCRNKIIVILRVSGKFVKLC